MSMEQQPPEDAPEVRESRDLVSGEVPHEFPAVTVLSTAQSSRLQVAFYGEVPFETRQAAIEEQLAMELEAVKRHGERARAAKRIKEEYKEKLRDLIGAKKYAQIRAYRADQKRAQAKLFRPPGGPEVAQREVDETRLSQQEESLRFLRRLGVDVEQIKDLRRQARVRLAEAVPPPTPTGEGGSARVLLPEEVPSAIRADRTGVFTMFEPPFPLSSTWGPWAHGEPRVRFESTRWLDPSRGYIGISNRLWNPEADDFDTGSAQYGTGIGLQYLKPYTDRTKKLVIRVYCRLDEGFHRVGLRDEWGVSDSRVDHMHYIRIARSSSPNGPPPYSGGVEMSYFQLLGQTSGSWDERGGLQNGITYIRQVELLEGSSAAMPINLYIGIDTYNSYYADDVKVSSDITFRWFIPQVFVRLDDM